MTTTSQFLSPAADAKFLSDPAALVPAGGWQPISLANAVNASAVPPVDLGGSNFQFDVPAGAASTNPADGVWATWALEDVLGQLCTTGTVQPFGLFLWAGRVEEVTPPALPSSIYVAIGICNSSTLVGAYNSLFGGWTYTTGTRTARAGGGNTAPAITDDASPQGDMRQALITSTYSFLGQFGTVWTTGATAAGLNIFGAFDGTSRIVNAAFGAAPASPHLFIAAGRTGATVGTISTTARMRYSALQMGTLAP